jgi:aerobic-type carbon monoxide dehydrogenase small subunit (CoxS/CutS family)
VADATVRLSVDGAEVSADVPLSASLLDLLSGAGTDLPAGCHEGRCGSCTVLVGGETVPACAVPAYLADGEDVRTVATAARADLTAALARQGAVQCGYCIPGIVVTLSTLLERGNSLGDAASVREALDGHLCRCTGYAAMIDAVLEVTAPT